jgi:putative oxidoreductase
MTTNTTAALPVARRSRTVTVVLWVVQIGLALFFAAAGAMKLAGDPTAVAMYETIGLGQWFRYLTGICEVAGAIGLLVPRLSGVAATGLIGVMIGATVTNLFVIPGAAPSAVMTVLLAVVFALIAWARLPQTRRLIGMLRR